MRKDLNNNLIENGNSDFNIEEIEQVTAPATFDGELDVSASAYSTSILSVCRCS
jgi:hypothetical protein